MRGAARLNDKTFGVCSHPSHTIPINIGGKIVSASGNIECNGRPLARLGDKVLSDCGHTSKIISASTSEDPNNKRGTARLNDKVGNGPYKAKIISASSDTFPNPG